MATFRLEIFSPAGKAAEADVEEVYLPSVTGEIGVLPEHAGYTGLLSTGIVSFREQQSGENTKIVVTGGFCTFENNTLRILGDQVDLADDFREASKLEQLESGLPELRETLEGFSLDSAEWQDAKKQVDRIEAIRMIASH